MLTEVILFNGDAVRSLLEELGWNTTELAYHLGVTEGAVQRWYWTNQVPKLSTVLKLNVIAKALIRAHSLRKIVSDTPAPEQIDGLDTTALEQLKARLSSLQQPLARTS